MLATHRNWAVFSRFFNNFRLLSLLLDKSLGALPLLLLLLRLLLVLLGLGEVNLLLLLLLSLLHLHLLVLLLMLMPSLLLWRPGKVLLLVSV